MSDILGQIGSRVRHLRKEHGLSQEDLGERAGLSYKYIGEIERGQTNPTVDVLFRIASALNVQLDELFFDVEGYKHASRKSQLRQEIAHILSSMTLSQLQIVLRIVRALKEP